jgi:predicted nucleic acid-binding protein
VTYLLDTNTCIGWLRQNQPQIVARIQAQAQTDIVCLPTTRPSSAGLLAS